MKRAQMIFRRAMNDDYYLPAEKVLEMTTIDAAGVWDWMRRLVPLKQEKERIL